MRAEAQYGHNTVMSLQARAKIFSGDVYYSIIVLVVALVNYLLQNFNSF
jgi:hypothetical protein